jgi:KaiC/GvpD/RAD55 family RecA-like ATPase
MIGRMPDTSDRVAAEEVRRRSERSAEKVEGSKQDPFDWIPTIQPIELLTPRSAFAAEGSSLDVGTPLIQTGWKLLDDKIGGFAIPSLNVLGAAPKSGKSTWAQIIAARHAALGGVTYHLDLENGRRRYYRRLLCRLLKIGPGEVTRAFAYPKADGSAAVIDAWYAMKANIDKLDSLYAEFSPPIGLQAGLTNRLMEVRRKAGSRKLLVVIDSLQKLPGKLDDRRATVDEWVRLFERLRIEIDAAFLVISEIKRGKSGEYVVHESAFKESGGIEYAADLAMTMTRPRADEKKKDSVSTLRIELARDCDKDPRGMIAVYEPKRPWYGLEEKPPPDKAEATGSAMDRAIIWLREFLSYEAMKPGDVIKSGEKEGHKKSTVQRAKAKLQKDKEVAVDDDGWRLV